MTYHDVWPGIDMEWFIDSVARPEYQFVIRPGGDVAAIQLRYRGAHGTRLDAAHLVLDVQHGPIRESLPRSYVQSTGNNVDVRYRALGNDVYGFTVPPIDIAMGETLVIDPMPELLWATYYGGTGSDQFSSVALLPNKDVVLAGSTWSWSFIATIGAHQEVRGGGTKVFLAKFTSTGSRLWGTYYSGSGWWDIGKSVAVCPNGDVVVTGYVESVDGIATQGAFQTKHLGKTEAFVAKFDTRGQRRWGTYLGGSEGDEGRAICVGPKDDIVVVGRTFSLGYPVTDGSHQQQIGDSTDFVMGSADAFVTVLTSEGDVRWSTFYGGESSEDLESVAVAKDGKVAVIGTTLSKYNIATVGTHQAFLAHKAESHAESDSYVVVFDEQGKRQWATYFGGLSTEYGYSVAVSESGNVVVAGTTRSLEGIASAQSHLPRVSETQGGYAFLAVFTVDGSLKWATYIGGNNSTSANSVVVDNLDRIFVVGSTSSYHNIATSNALQPYRSGQTDAYVNLFSMDGRLRWGTYYGGLDQDFGNSISVSSDGLVVIAGSTRTAGLVFPEGSHQPTFGDGKMDALIVVYNIDGKPTTIGQQGNLAVERIASIHPNPASGYTRLTTSATSDAVLNVVDVRGRLLISQPIPAGNTETTISTAGLAPGSYYLRLLPADGADPLQQRTQALIVVQ